MKRVLKLRGVAQADIQAVADFIAMESTQSADSFVDSVYDTMLLIRENPLAWPVCTFQRMPRLESLRWRSVARYDRYLMFYLVDDVAVDVVRILHGSRQLVSAFENLGT